MTDAAEGGNSRASITKPDKKELLALYSMIQTNPHVVKSSDYNGATAKEYAALMSQATAVDPQGVVAMLMEYASQHQSARIRHTEVLEPQRLRQRQRASGHRSRRSGRGRGRRSNGRFRRF